MNSLSQAFNMIQSVKHTETIIAFLGLVEEKIMNSGLQRTWYIRG